MEIIPIKILQKKNIKETRKMRIIKDMIIKRIAKLKNEIHEIEMLEKTLPKEELICAKNGKGYKWYLKNAGK